LDFVQGALVRRVSLLALAAIALFAAYPVAAQPLTAAQVVSDTHQGVYVSVDGVYERVKLPVYTLSGYRSVTAADGTDLGPSQTFNPRFGAGGVRGAIGTAIPGSNARIELGGSYMEGGSTDAAQPAFPEFAAGILMNGTVVAPRLNCGTGGFDCPASATLRTDYRAWSLNAKAATDFRFGSVVVTPSVAVFGGITRANQTLLQTFRHVAVGQVGTYTASTGLQWRDLGVRGGLNLRAFVTPALSVGLGGSVGVAARKTEFAGSDIATSNTAFMPAGTSALTLEDSRTALLANTEASLAWHLTPAIIVTGFAGFNYDHDVPGIVGPAYVSPLTGPTSPASLFFDRQTNFYAGGGVTVRFASMRP
jgi:hypothetical protein